VCISRRPPVRTIRPAHLTLYGLITPVIGLFTTVQMMMIMMMILVSTPRFLLSLFQRYGSLPTVHLAAVNAGTHKQRTKEPRRNSSGGHVFLTHI